jgi:hypothetical protein
MSTKKKTHTVSLRRFEAQEKRWRETHQNQIAVINRLQGQIEALKGFATIAAVMLDREGTWADEDQTITTLQVNELQATDIGRYAFETTENGVKVIRKAKSTNEPE